MKQINYIKLALAVALWTTATGTTLTTGTGTGTGTQSLTAWNESPTVNVVWGKTTPDRGNNTKVHKVIPTFTQLDRTTG